MMKPVRIDPEIETLVRGSIECALGGSADDFSGKITALGAKDGHPAALELLGALVRRAIVDVTGRSTPTGPQLDALIDDVIVGHERYFDFWTNVAGHATVETVVRHLIGLPTGPLPTIARSVMVGALTCAQLLVIGREHGEKWTDYLDELEDAVEREG